MLAIWGDNAGPTASGLTARTNTDPTVSVALGPECGELLHTTQARREIGLKKSNQVDFKCQIKQYSNLQYKLEDLNIIWTYLFLRLFKIQMDTWDFLVIIWHLKRNSAESETLEYQEQVLWPEYSANIRH